MELTDTEVLESGNTDCCLSDLDGTGIGELVVVAAGNFVVVVSVAVAPLIFVVVAAEIVAVVAVEVVAVVVVVVDTAEVDGIDTNLLDSVSDLDFPELGIVLHFWLVLVYSLEIPLLMIPVVAAEIGLMESS